MTYKHRSSAIWNHLLIILMSLVLTSCDAQIAGPVNDNGDRDSFKVDTSDACPPDTLDNSSNYLPIEVGDIWKYDFESVYDFQLEPRIWKTGTLSVEATGSSCSDGERIVDVTLTFEYDNYYYNYRESTDTLFTTHTFEMESEWTESANGSTLLPYGAEPVARFHSDTPDSLTLRIGQPVLPIVEGPESHSFASVVAVKDVGVVFLQFTCCTGSLALWEIGRFYLESKSVNQE